MMIMKRTTGAKKEILVDQRETQEMAAMAGQRSNIYGLLAAVFRREMTER
jgi:hypothetical protein